MMKNCAFVLALSLAPSMAAAEVVERSASGFTVRTIVPMSVSGERAFNALVQEIGTWWDPAHTYSRDSRNLRLTANPGGCFCESFPRGGGVQHAAVIHVVPGQLLRLTGALGPLQQAAITGTLTWQFAAAEQGVNATVTYAVGGTFPGGLDKIADAVDGMISGQLRRLKAHVEQAAQTGSSGSTGLPATPIEPDRLAAHVKVLAADEFEGRGPATGGEQKTVDYLVKQLSAVGVQPGGDPDGRGGRRWTQDVQLAQSVIQGPVTATLKVGGMSQPLRQGEEVALRATHLPTRRLAIQDAPIVFVGYGVKAPERKWDDFKGVDLRGKIALVLVNDPDFEADLNGRFDGKAMTYYGRWTYKYEEAARQGARGMLVIHETAPASYGWATVKNSNTIAMFDIVRQDPASAHPPLEGWIQRDVTVALFKRAGLDFEAEKKKAQSPDFRPVTLANATFSAAFNVTQSRVVSKNVAGLLPGASRPDETVIYSAHWDHLGVGEPDAGGDRIYNGAQDNATGVAALLELARVHASRPRAARSVVFLFVTAEEKGLLGSAYYADHPLYPAEKTVAVLNMDSMATSGPARDLGFKGGGQVTLEDDLEKAARATGRRVSPDPRPEAGSFYRSDHFSFAKVGVPALSIGSGDDLYAGGVKAGEAAREEYNAKRYHQPADQWAAGWDLRGLAIDTGLFYTLGRELAESNRWPEWKPASEFKAMRDKTAAARR